MADFAGLRGGGGWGEVTERRILLAKTWACHMALASSGDSDTCLASSCKLLTGTKFRDYWECLE